MSSNSGTFSGAVNSKTSAYVSDAQKRDSTNTAKELLLSLCLRRNALALVRAKFPKPEFNASVVLCQSSLEQPFTPRVRAYDAHCPHGEILPRITHLSTTNKARDRPERKSRTAEAGRTELRGWPRFGSTDRALGLRGNWRSRRVTLSAPSCERTSFRDWPGQLISGSAPRSGRGGGLCSRDLLLPKQARY